jgi:hypothetical protein
VGVRFAEPGAPDVLLEIEAHVRELVSVQPAEFRFARVGKGQPFEAALEIHNYSESDFNRVVLEPSRPWLTVRSLQPAEVPAVGQAVPPRQVWRAVVGVVTDQLPTGSHSCEIVVRSELPDVPNKVVPVELCVASPVEAIPGQMFFGRVPADKPTKHRVAFYFTAGAAPPDTKDALLSHDLGSSLALEWVKVHGERWDLVATYTPPAKVPEDAVEGTIKVSFRGNRLPDVQLPVILRVEKS